MPAVLRKLDPADQLVAEAATFAALAGILYESKDYPVFAIDKINEIIGEIQDLRIDMFVALKEKKHEDVC